MLELCDTPMVKFETLLFIVPQYNSWGCCYITVSFIQLKISQEQRMNTRCFVWKTMNEWYLDAIM